MSVKKIDTAAIEGTAAAIDNLNRQLENTLNNSKSTVQSLNGVWTGQAAEATIGAYTAFETKYSQVYREMLDQYVKFLKGVAATGYQETESRAASMADMI